MAETPLVQREAGFYVPAFAKFALWKVDSHFSTVTAGRKFAWLRYGASVLRRDNAYGAKLFADKGMRRFAVVTGVCEELVKGL